MLRGISSRYLITAALMALVLASSVYAEEPVEVTDPKSSTGHDIPVVGVIEEGGKFYRDRDYTMEGVPEQYLECTSIMFSADSVQNVNIQWTFEIDRPAYVYLAHLHGEGTPPEDRPQDPTDWFNDGFTDTGEVLPVPSLNHEYRIYKSNEPYPEGEVTIYGMDVPFGEGSVYQIFFVQGADLAVSSHHEKLAARWGEIKSSK